MIRGFSRSHAEAIQQARAQRPFVSLEDFAQRTQLSRPVLTRLAKADAFASLGLDRRRGLWEVLGQGETLPLFGSALATPKQIDKRTEGQGACLPLTPLAACEEVVADYQTIGLSLRAHPMSFLRPALQRRRVLRAEQLTHWPAGRRVWVAGLVLMRQRPSTASGITFVTLEDETGVANLIVRPTIWERYHRAARRATGLLAYGTLERKDEVIHVLVSKLEDIAVMTGQLNTRSRDFR